MKKIFILIFLIILITGCSVESKDDILKKDVIKKIFSSIVVDSYKMKKDSNSEGYIYTTEYKVDNDSCSANFQFDNYNKIEILNIPMANNKGMCINYGSKMILYILGVENSKIPETLKNDMKNPDEKNYYIADDKMIFFSKYYENNKYFIEFNSDEIIIEILNEQKTLELEREKERKRQEKILNATFAQQQALETAEGYLDSLPFSKEGLYDQLNFEGFTNKEAQFAVDIIQVSWNEQALLKGQQYLDFQLASSKQGLYNLLIFEKFTSKQAKYAVSRLF